MFTSYRSLFPRPPAIILMVCFDGLRPNAGGSVRSGRRLKRGQIHSVTALHVMILYIAQSSEGERQANLGKRRAEPGRPPRRNDSPLAHDNTFTTRSRRISGHVINDNEAAIEWNESLFPAALQQITLAPPTDTTPHHGTESGRVPPRDMRR